MNHRVSTLDELKNGFSYDKKSNDYICGYCHQVFREGQIFQIDNRFYLADQAIATHMQSEHGGNLKQLLGSDSRYNVLTEKQKELMSLFYSGITDKEIAKKLGVSNSTIRRQRFTFREKAKQARFYLAVYEQVFEDVRKKKES